jgi:membrane protease YdiL (CAAX protease family)
VLWFLFTLVISIALELNREYGSSVVWFPFLLCGLVLILLTRPEVALTNGDANTLAQQVRVGAIGLLLLLTGIALSGWSAVISGAAVLKGDSLKESEEFRDAYSFFYVLTVGVIEEFCVRRYCQLPLSKEMGRALAWLIASVLLVALHSFSVLTVNGFLFVCLMSIATGYLVYRGSTVRQAAMLHATVNSVLVAIVLIARK